jgi:hypothetical protein
MRIGKTDRNLFAISEFGNCGEHLGIGDEIGKIMEKCENYLELGHLF